MSKLAKQSNTPGCFITVEGIDGAGKTAATETIVSTIEEAGLSVISTREPGGTAVGEALRELVLSRDFEFEAETEILIIFASRAQHMREVILPNLEAGHWVLSDRFTDSTYAYQGAGRQIPFERIQQIEDWLLGGFKPSLTLLMDANTNIGRERVLNNEGSLDRFESMDQEFHRRVRHAYREIARLEPERVKCIDATETIEQVSFKTREILQNFISSYAELDF